MAAPRTWNKAEWTLLDGGDDREGTVSSYLRYNIGVWTFGFRFEHDPSWYDFHIDVGPLELSFIYWRQYVAVLK